MRLNVSIGQEESEDFEEHEDGRLRPDCCRSHRLYIQVCLDQTSIFGHRSAQGHGQPVFSAVRHRSQVQGHGVLRWRQYGRPIYCIPVRVWAQGQSIVAISRRTCKDFSGCQPRVVWPPLGAQTWRTNWKRRLHPFWTALAMSASSLRPAIYEGGSDPVFGRLQSQPISAAIPHTPWRWCFGRANMLWGTTGGVLTDLDDDDDSRMKVESRLGKVVYRPRTQTPRVIE
ncbi:hypothetical protein B0H66DRAFT_373034 [Apodospora peruviana]|uniref:Uncharacterized protein n=1 Tax=Apodospora peruviana TaxID=516989 RepID=A0AAE0HWF5_9PEZI|nr:hypothetical protein B0H66DRAFT_373034 [Apodospora peruviana]